jgi:thiol-disulfide isomerase/thioredoxin
MKKVIKVSVIVCVVLLTSYLVTGIGKKVQYHKSVAEKIAKFPAFSFMRLSNEAFRSSEIVEGPVLVVHFHPECEHCQYEISEILKSAIPESCTSVILVSSASPDSIRKFLSRFNVFDYPSVIPLADNSYNFEEVFGSGIIPSSYIYSRKLNLVKVLHGEVKTETILKYLQLSE